MSGSSKDPVMFSFGGNTNLDSMRLSGAKVVGESRTATSTAMDGSLLQDIRAAVREVYDCALLRD